MYNNKIGYVAQQKTMTIIDETATISSAKNKQPFSPQPTSEPYVKVPSPDRLNIEEYMPKKSGGNKTSNAFIIYRTVFSKVLIEEDYQSKMTDVSKWAAMSWKNEKADLKVAYKKFAKDIQRIHKKRSQDALISRKRPITIAATPRLENQPSTSVPSPMVPEIPIYQQPTNLIVGQANINNIPETFPSYHLSIAPNFNSESPDKEFQANDLLNSMTTFSVFDHSPVSSSIEALDLNGDNLNFLMNQALQQQEFYPETQPYYENNGPEWVYY